MKKCIKTTLSIVLIKMTILGLTACDIFSVGGQGRANITYSNPSLKWNYIQNYYILESTVSNIGNGDASGVTVYYYYTDLYSMEKYSKTSYIGIIKAGDSITWTSNYIYPSEYGSEIINYGISNVKWS